MTNSVSERSPLPSPQILDRFLVCGLGSLGQHCVVALKEFGVEAIAIEQVPPSDWEITKLPELITELIVGDCCQNSVLARAKIERCRAALIVTGNERVNVETALAVRLLNPYTRLIVRSAQSNLNQLLERQLGNFLAFEPTELPTAALVLAALGSETVGLLNLDGQQLRVVKLPIKSEHPWCNARRLHELNSHKRRLLGHVRPGVDFLRSFHQWQPDESVLPGDTLICLEVVEPLLSLSKQQLRTAWRRPRQSSWFGKLPRLIDNLPKYLNRFKQSSLRQQVRRVALICGAIVLVLLLTGTALFRWSHPGTTWLSAFYVTAILLLGGYADLFGSFGPIADLPRWLQLFSLGLTLAGTAFVGVLYALLTEALLSSKFEFTKQRPPVPTQDHVVIIGLERVGQRVAARLHQLKQPIVGITFNADFDRTILPQIPLIMGNLSEALHRANLATAKSILVLTDDEILNLEVALMTRRENPHSQIVISTTGQHLSEHLTQILPEAQVLCTYAVAAEAFVGAAFGENILHLFRLNERTILVTEYQIEAEDTLHGLLLAEVAYGYEVVPVLHQRPPHTSTLMPSDELRLAVGDRLVVLATIEGLQRIEQGRPNLELKRWQVRLEKLLTPDAAFEGANLLVRIAGCSLAVARELVNNLPQTLPTPLYQHQAQCLVRELKKALVQARLECL